MHGRFLALTSAIVLGAAGVLARQESHAQALVAKARAALGGEARLATVQTFSFEGTVILSSGPSKVFGHFAIHGRLPDAFVRYRALSPVGRAGGAAIGPTINPQAGGNVSSSLERYSERVGFVGPRLIHEPLVRPHEIRDLGPAAPEQIEELYRNAQRQFLPFMLGLFVASFPGAPVQFTDGPGDAVLVVNQLGNPITVAFDPQSGLPVRAGDFVFSDRRDVAGVKVPFRISRMAGSRAIETLEVKKCQIDVPLPASAFRN